MFVTSEKLRGGISEKTRFLTVAHYLAAPPCIYMPVDIKYHRTNTEPIDYSTDKKAQTHIFFANMCLPSHRSGCFAPAINSPLLTGHRLYNAPIKI